jgi:hypothetical protein
MQSVKTLPVPSDTLTDITGSSDNDELPKRRGKHRRRHKKPERAGSREPEAFHGLAEPGETQVNI